MNAADKEQKFATERGDTLLALVRRVYGIHEQERVYQIAMIVASYHPDNVAVVKSRVAADLPPGKVIVYPPWPLVAQRLEQLDKAKKPAAEPAPKPTIAAAKGALAAPTFRQVGLSPKTSVSRTLTKTLADHVGLTPSQAHDRLRPITQEALDPMRTQGPDVIAMRAAGDTLANALPESVVKQLLALGDKGIDENVLLLLRDLSPRNFPPNQNAALAVSVLVEGFALALMARVAAAAKLEIDRRYIRLQGLVSGKDPAFVPDARTPASAALEAPDFDTALRKLRGLLGGDPPSLVTPRVLADVHARFGVQKGSRAGSLIAAQPLSKPSALSSFLDAFGPGTNDGPFAEQLYALANPTKDTQRDAVVAADRRLALVDAELAPYLNTETPNGAIAKVLSALMQKWRAQRTPETADNDLAEERRMLAGRNYISFRKDVALAVDNRIAQSALTPRQKVAVALAVLTAIGHRMAGMKLDEIEALVERFAVAAG